MAISWGWKKYVLKKWFLTIWKTLDKFYMKYPLQFTHVMRWIDKGKCIDKCSTHTYMYLQQVLTPRYSTNLSKYVSKEM